MTVETKAPDSPGDEKMVQMSEEALRRLLADVQSGGAFLPPGAFRDPQSGVVYREVRVPSGFREIKSEDGKTVIRREQRLRKQKRLVMLVTDSSPVGLLETIKKAKRSSNENGPDVYHPRYGWLRGGYKREVDVPENLGTGAQPFEMEYLPIEDSATEGASTATVQGVPLDDQPDPSSPGSDLASFGEALTTAGDVPREPAPSGRRNKEN